MVDPRQPTLRGSLRAGALVPFIEFLAASGHTGCASLEGPLEATGRVLVQGGQVIHAECRCGGEPRHEGLDALTRMLGWRQAYVELREGLPSPVPRTIVGSVEGALLEAARRSDEEDAAESLPERAAVRLGHDLGGIAALGGRELAVLAKVRSRTTVASLRQETRAPDLDALLLSLHDAGLIEIEGVPRGVREAEVSLADLVPARCMQGSRAWRSIAGTLEPLDEMVLALVDGERSGDDIRYTLGLGPGRTRACLNSLRAAGLISF